MDPNCKSCNGYGCRYCESKDGPDGPDFELKIYSGFGSIPMVVRIRRGNAIEWREVNPILRPQEPGFNTTTGQLKRGDGVTPWNDLPVFCEIVLEQT